MIQFKYRDRNGWMWGNCSHRCVPSWWPNSDAQNKVGCLLWRRDAHSRGWTSSSKWTSNIILSFSLVCGMRQNTHLHFIPSRSNRLWILEITCLWVEFQYSSRISTFLCRQKGFTSFFLQPFLGFILCWIAISSKFTWSLCTICPINLWVCHLPQSWESARI